MDMLAVLVVIVVVASLATPFIVLGLTGRVTRLAEQVMKLAGRVERLGYRFDRWGTPTETGPAPAPPEFVRQPREEPPAPLKAEPLPPLFEERVAVPEAIEPAPPPSPRPEAPARDAAPSDLPPVQEHGSRPTKRVGAAAAGLETAIGQRWLVRVGALVLVVGVGFFYAYAIEKGWITKPQRAISGAIVGLGVVALGIYFNRRGFTPLAQGFVGCGAGILFLDAFASHRLYHLLSPEVALIAMTGVTALTVAIALRWSAMPLVLLAQIGGYLTPFILEDQMPDRALVVFAYIFVIDAGFLFVGARRRWAAVQIVAAIGTPVLLLIARSMDSSLSPVQVTGWAWAFDLLFLAMSAAPAIIRRESLARFSWIVIPAMAASAALLAEDAIAASHPYALALGLVGLAVVHAAFAEATVLRSREDTGGREVVRLCAAALLVDAVRFALRPDDQMTTIAFTAAGVALALAAWFRDSFAFRAGAAAAFVVAIGRVIMFHLHGAKIAAVEPFWNPDLAIGLSVAGAVAIASFADRGTRWIGLSAGSLLLVVVITGEIAFAITAGVADVAYRLALVQVARAVSVTGVLVGFASAGRKTGRWILLAIAGVHALFALAGFGHLVGFLQKPPQVFLLNPVCLGSLFVPLGLMAAAWILRDMRPGWIARSFATVGAILPLVALSFEAHRFARHAWSSTDALVDAGSAAVSVTWALYAAALLTIGISRRLRVVRLGALGLLGITLTKVVVSDLAQLDELARIASFIALGVVLMAGAWAYHRFAGRIFGRAEEAESAAPAAP